MARAKWTPDQEAEIRALRAEIAALKARDCDAAEEAMRLHLTRQREALRSLMQSQSSRLSGVAMPDLNFSLASKVQTT